MLLLKIFHVREKIKDGLEIRHRHVPHGTQIIKSLNTI